MRTMKKIAWLLSFIMIFSAVLGNVKLTALAEGETFTINIADSSNVENNVVQYSFDNSTWNTAQDGVAIDVSGQNQIFVKAVRGNESSVSVNCTSGGGFAGDTDFGGITGGQCFTLASDTSYILNVSFAAMSSGGGGNYIVNFGEGSWTVGDVTVTANKMGEQTLSESDEITLTNFNAETMEVKVSASGGFNTTLTVTEGKTSLGAKTSTGGFPNEALTFSVEAKSTSGGGGGSTNYTVNFGTGTWTVGDVTVNANNTGEKTLSESDEITLTNFNAETMEVRVSSSGGFNTTLTVTEGKTSLGARDGEGGLPNEALTFSVVAKSTGGDPDPTPTNAISFVLEGDSVSSATVEYSTNGGTSWTAISGNSEVLDANVDSAQIRVSGTGIDITSTDIPGTSGNVMTSGTAYTVTEKKQYHIQIDKSVCTVTWAYNNSLGEDALVEHGTVKIISAVKAGGDTWSGIEPALPGASNNQQDANGGRVAIIPGSIVTVEIVPDYKYQFVAGTLNGTTIQADTNKVSTFTFTMPSTNLHLSALFSPTEDKIENTATGVSDVKMENCDGIIDSGNLKLTVKNATLTDDDKSKLLESNEGKGVTVDKWLEVDMDQIVNQGRADAAWTIDQDELPHTITVVLTVGTGLDTTKQYVVVREHKGVYEQIPATYDSEAGTLTFESDKFSEYAVGTVVTASDVWDTINSNWYWLDPTTNGDASNTVSTLETTYGVTGVAGAVQNSSGTFDMDLLSTLMLLEYDYADENTITIEPVLIESAVSGSVSGVVKVIGAAFNAANGSSIKLVFDDKSDPEIDVGSTYSKSVQLDIKLVQKAASGITTPITTLQMPVTIIMQVPAGINASRLVILHDIDGDGTSDETVPYSLIGNEVTFTVTHFSNFAFAEKAVSSGGGGTGGSGSTGSGSGSSSSTGTAAAVSLSTTTPQKDAVPKTGEDAFPVEGLYLLLVALGAGIIVFSKKGRVRL